MATILKRSSLQSEKSYIIIESIIYLQKVPLKPSCTKFECPRQLFQNIKSENKKGKLSMYYLNARKYLGLYSTRSRKVGLPHFKIVTFSNYEIYCIINRLNNKHFIIILQLKNKCTKNANYICHIHIKFQYDL